MTATVTDRSARAPSHGSRRRAGPLARRRRRAGILLSIPAIVVVLSLLLIPIGQAVYYSMTTWDGITSTWIGPQAYVAVLHDPIFWRVLENNALLLLAVPFALGIPLILATCLLYTSPSPRD